MNGVRLYKRTYKVCRIRTYHTTTGRMHIRFRSVTETHLCLKALMLSQIIEHDNVTG